MKNLQAPLSEQELTRLDRLLLIGDVPEDAMILSSLDGYLTAIAVGPETVAPSEWLPHVFSESEPHIPQFESAKEGEELLILIMRRLNQIISGLMSHPRELTPIYSVGTHGEDQREYPDPEAWAMGFWSGIELRWESWQPLLESEKGQELIRAIRLLGASEVIEDEEELTATPSQREALGKQIPEAVMDIYFHWLPYRHAAVERTVAQTYVRAHPKLGRNDPCPCGSGKKFKKCCGVAGTVH
ncbi:UPF0149 family protein [Dyella sp.]|uniref:UPF0149 family protein n=1 Tax=Dyella sp. TaxID=1869338 RepID=UPI0031F2FC31